MEYIPLAIKEFKDIEEVLEKHASDRSWEVPKIKMEIQLDSKEIRPEKIDRW